MSESSPLRYKIMIMILPVGVIIGTIIFMYMYFHNERIEEQEHSVIVSHGFRVEDLQDMVGKFTDAIGERDVDTEQGRTGLKAAASMIEGRLGPQNVGFPVKKDRGEAKHGLLWKGLWVDIRGEKSPEKVIIAAVSFAGAGEDADANAASTLVLIASAMARDPLARTVRFVFLPIDRASDVQNRWLLENCLEEGEVCDGILGLTVMDKKPEVGGSDWVVETPSNQDKAWWEFLEKGGTRPIGGAPSAWITHPVFSSKVWAGQRKKRLDKTIGVASAITSWLRRAAD